MRPARHQPVLTFVSMAGTNDLLPDARLTIESKEYVEEVEMQPRIQYARSLPVP